MKFQVGMRIYFDGLTHQRRWHGTILKALKDGFYLVDDGTGLGPRAIHGSRLGIIKPQKTDGVFA